MCALLFEIFTTFTVWCNKFYAVSLSFFFKDISSYLLPPPLHRHTLTYIQNLSGAFPFRVDEQEQKQKPTIADSACHDACVLYEFEIAIKIVIIFLNFITYESTNSTAHTKNPFRFNHNRKFRRASAKPTHPHIVYKWWAIATEIAIKHQ